MHKPPTEITVKIFRFAQCHSISMPARACSSWIGEPGTCRKLGFAWVDQNANGRVAGIFRPTRLFFSNHRLNLTANTCVRKKSIFDRRQSGFEPFAQSHSHSVPLREIRRKHENGTDFFKILRLRFWAGKSINRTFLVQFPKRK